jgi:diguanylate cyclase (GGDEF)-like protein
VLAAVGPLAVPDITLDERFSLDPLVGGAGGLRFYAGILLFLESEQPIGILSLLDSRPHSSIAAYHIAELAAEMTSTLVQRRQARSIAQLKAQLEAQVRLTREQASSLAHSTKIFDRASAAARIGVWECDLPGERLRWTDVVYDIFEIPRGAPLDRKQTLSCYTEESRKTLEMLRGRAIEARGSFGMDAEITTGGGRRRWIRITATVESEEGVAVRIFGMKQDITEEKLLSERTRYLAEFDVMTGLANRSQFQSRLAQSRGRDGEGKPIGALLLVDLDGFKQVNDTFGHAVGDECLKETATRLASVCHDAELVARIGGDEFAVLAAAHLDRDAIERLAAEVVAIVGRPVDLCGRSFKIGASVGIALAEGCEPSDLFKQADAALYAAKAGGRNTFRTFGHS